MAADIDLVVKSKLKSAVKKLNVSSDVPAALNNILLDELAKSANRAKLNGRKTLQAKDVFLGEKAKKSQEDLIVKSKIKVAVDDLNVSSEVAGALNMLTHNMLIHASARAQANGRRTLQARDL